MGDFISMFFIATLVIVVLFMCLVCSSGTSLGRALLPKAVADAVAKLLPRTLIRDASANVDGDIVVTAGGTEHAKTVYVRRHSGMTFAWTCDAASEFPRRGNFAFTSLQHNLKPGSTIVPEKVKSRIQSALTEVLASKAFQPADPDDADIWIRVFAALEGEVELQTLSGVFDQRDGYAWGTALRTALQHDSVHESATFARGSLLFDVVDSKSGRVLWQAVAIADIVIDVSSDERDRRTRQAITEVFRRFPPK